MIISRGHTTYYNPSVGGRNLFGYGSDLGTDLSGMTVDNFSIVTEDGYNCAHASGALNTTARIASKIPFTPKPKEAVTFSAWIKIVNIVPGTTNFMCEFYPPGQTVTSLNRWVSISGWSLYVDGVFVSSSTRHFNEVISDSNWHHVAMVCQYYDAEFTLNLEPAIYLRDATGDLYVRHIKYERGNTATDWTPAPEDVDGAIEDAREEASQAVNTLSENVNESINSIVTIINGESESDPDSLVNKLKAVGEQLADLNSDFFLRWQELSSFIAFKDENDAPNLVLGNENSEYNVVVTNTALVFRKGNSPIAYMNGQELYVENSLSFGNFRFYQRDNGHFTLKYIGGGN